MLTPDHWHDIFLLSLELFGFFSLSLDVLKFHCDIAQYKSFLIHCHECSVGLYDLQIHVFYFWGIFQNISLNYFLSIFSETPCIWELDLPDWQFSTFLTHIPYFWSSDSSFWETSTLSNNSICINSCFIYFQLSFSLNKGKYHKTFNTNLCHKTSIRFVYMVWWGLLIAFPFHLISHW